MMNGSVGQPRRARRHASACERSGRTVRSASDNSITNGRAPNALAYQLIPTVSMRILRFRFRLQVSDLYFHG